MKKYQEAYLKAKNQNEIKRVVNNANLNLSKSEADKFMKWQVEQMEIDGRKYNGGARAGTGPKLKDEMEKKVTVSFYIKRKHIEAAGKKIQPIVDKFNSK